MAGVCKLCGTPHGDGAKFCTECGAVLISRVGDRENTEAVEPKNEAVVTNTVEENGAPVVTENVTETGSVETVETPTVNNGTTPYSGVANTYGAANAETPSAYSNPYSAPNGSNPYGGANYNAPNGSNPYGGANYNAPNGGNPYGGANYNAPNGGNPYGGANYNAPNGSNPYAPNGVNPYGVPYNPNAPQMQPQRTLNIGMLVFSIINIILGCCGCTGIIFGGAGLAFTMMAKNAKTDGDAANYNKIALILNIIGVITTILVFVAAFAMGLAEGFETAY